MKKRLWYIVPILILLAGLLGPALFANKNHETQPANSPNVSTSDSQHKTSSHAKPPEVKKSSPDSVQSTATKEAKEVPATRKKPSDGLIVSIAVVGKNGTILYGPGSVTLPGKSKWGMTVMEALAATGLPYSMSTTWSGFVESVAGEHNKGMSGWMYAVDGKAGSVSATREPVGEGDKVVWWYSDSMASTPPNWGDLSKPK